jgi:hypothetical protein
VWRVGGRSWSRRSVQRCLWETLIDDLTDYRDVRWVVEYLHEQPGVTNIGCQKRPPAPVAPAAGVV